MSRLVSRSWSATGRGLLPYQAPRLLEPRGPGGQPHTEASAAARAVLGPDAAAVCFGDVPHDRQPQARATLDATAGAIHTVKAVEHAIERLRWESRSVVLDHQQRHTR